MNSAADLRRHHEREALNKAKDKVFNAIKNDPLGLSISQLMGICRLSVKTLRAALELLEVEEHQGIYSLVNANQVADEVVAQPKPVAKPKPELANNEAKISVEKAILHYLEDFPNGLSKAELMATAEMSDKQFTNSIYRLTQNGSVKRIGKLGSFKYLLAKHAEKEIDVIKPVEVPATPREPAKEVWEVFCDKPTEEPVNAISSLKAQIKTIVTRKSELTLKEDELGVLLSDLFGLANVQFCVDGGRLVGVRLFEEVVA
ncbi:hypothetical protein [Acinetobacter lwoffii]|uniref:hypothetical protein n=1 Tax=Acinetobacter lwoffii TaxID=28090 RepID=UPI0030094398